MSASLHPSRSASRLETAVSSGLEHLGWESVHFHLTAHGCWQWLEATWHTLTGHDPQLCLGSFWYDLLPITHRAAARRCWQTALAKRQPTWQYRTTWLNGQGQHSPISLSLDFLYRADGSLRGAWGKLQLPPIDTDPQQAIVLAHQLLPYTGLAVALLGDANRLLFASPAFHQAFAAVTSEERLDPLRWLHPDDLPSWEAATQYASANLGSRCTLTLRVRLAGAGWQPAELHLYQLPPQATIKGLLVRVEDAGPVQEMGELRRQHNTGLLSAILNAEEQTRARIAHDLHDSLSQTLNAARMMAGLALEHLAHQAQTHPAHLMPETQEILQISGQTKSLQHAQRYLEQSVELLNEGVSEIRELSQSLTPSILLNFGLRQALKSLCHRWQKLHPDVRLRIRIGMIPADLDAARQTNLYRFAQEALSNAYRHAQPKTVWLRLETQDGTVRLRVRDDGTGFAIENFMSGTVRPRGMGLQNLRTRCEIMDGRFLINSQIGKGTTVEARIPLQH